MKQGQTCNLYVQNIEKFEGDTLGDIAHRVRNHCKDNDVKVVNARVITNKFCNDAVSCKISVPITHADKALGIHIWPDGVKCRRWKNYPPNSRTADPEMTQSQPNEQHNTRSRSRSTRRNSQSERNKSQSRGTRSQSRQGRSQTRGDADQRLEHESGSPGAAATRPRA